MRAETIPETEQRTSAGRMKVFPFIICFAASQSADFAASMCTPPFTMRCPFAKEIHEFSGWSH